jgi:hypothetical protein
LEQGSPPCENVRWPITPATGTSQHGGGCSLGTVLRARTQTSTAEDAPKHTAGQAELSGRQVPGLEARAAAKFPHRQQLGRGAPERRHDGGCTAVRDRFEREFPRVYAVPLDRPPGSQGGWSGVAPAARETGMQHGARSTGRPLDGQTPQNAKQMLALAGRLDPIQSTISGPEALLSNLK